MYESVDSAAGFDVEAFVIALGACVKILFGRGAVLGTETGIE